MTAACGLRSSQFLLSLLEMSIVVVMRTDVEFNFSGFMQIEKIPKNSELGPNSADQANKWQSTKCIYKSLNILCMKLMCNNFYYSGRRLHVI